MIRFSVSVTGVSGVWQISGTSAALPVVSVPSDAMATQKNCYDNPAGWYLRIMIVPGERATMHKGIFAF
jgi:hypothetical protein